MKRALLALVVAIGAAGVARAEGPGSHLAPIDAAEPAPEARSSPDWTESDPEAAALVERWYEQLLGFNALEAYEAGTGHLRVTFAVARKWEQGLARIVIKVQEPSALSDLAVLILQNRARSDDFFVYLDFMRKVRRMRAPEFEFPISVGGGRLPYAEFRPFLHDELVHRRLPDEVVSGEPCRVVESRPVAQGFEFDRLEHALSGRTGVALRTRYFAHGRELSRIEVSPDDVEEHDGRFLPARRRIRIVGARPYDLVLQNLMIDPALPDRLFTSHAIRFQKFPRF
jgi:hypothetical protein